MQNSFKAAHLYTGQMESEKNGPGSDDNYFRNGKIFKGFQLQNGNNQEKQDKL